MFRPCVTASVRRANFYLINSARGLNYGEFEPIIPKRDSESPTNSNHHNKSQRHGNRRASNEASSNNRGAGSRSEGNANGNGRNGNGNRQNNVNNQQLQHTNDNCNENDQGRVQDHGLNNQSVDIDSGNSGHSIDAMVNSNNSANAQGTVQNICSVQNNVQQAHANANHSNEANFASAALAEGGNPSVDSNYVQAHVESHYQTNEKERERAISHLNLKSNNNHHHSNGNSKRDKKERPSKQSRKRGITPPNSTYKYQMINPPFETEWDTGYYRLRNSVYLENRLCPSEYNTVRFPGMFVSKAQKVGQQRS